MYVLSVRPVDHLWRQLAHESLPLVVLFQARSGRFWIDAETLDESFDFPDVKNLSIASLTGLKLLKVIKVPPHFHSVINWSEVIKSLPPLQNSLKFFKFFNSPLLQNPLKIFYINFTIQWWYKVIKNTLNLFLPLSGILKISERYRKLERVIRHEGMSKLDNLFKPIATNIFISLGESGQLVLPR